MANARISLRLTEDVNERLRNLLWHTRGTVVQWVNDAVEKELAAQEKLNGGAYPQRAGELRIGRPVG